MRIYTLNKPVGLLCLLMQVAGVYAQNVGIGTNLPTRARLAVNGAVGRTVAIFGGDTRGISLQGNDPAIGFNEYFDGTNSRFIGAGYAARTWFQTSSGNLFFDVFPTGLTDGVGTGTRTLTITKDGNVGIGNVMPNVPLQFSNVVLSKKIVLYDAMTGNIQQYYGFGMEPGGLRYQVESSGASHNFYAGNAPGFSPVPLVNIKGNGTVLIGSLSSGIGRLGINTGDPIHTLAVRQIGGRGIFLQEATAGTNWEFQARYTVSTNYGVLMMRYNNTDVGFFAQNGDYVTYSDRRLKTNIEHMGPTIAKLIRMEPMLYEMKAHNTRHEKSIGFIAQDVQAIFPELVSKGGNDEHTGSESFLGINYSGLSVIAIKAIKEQQAQIEMLMKRITALEAKLASNVLKSKND